MQVRSLFVHNFRSYGEAFFEFAPGVNLLWGHNAKGKTSILEAIHLLIYGRSFRSIHMQELIRHGANAFHVELSLMKHGIEQTLRMTFDGKERHVMHNSTPNLTISGLLGILQGVMLAPDDVALIKGAPHLRRHFLDLQLAQIDPLYVHYLTRYMMAMRNRNSLFKRKTVYSIEPWEEEMARAAAYIVYQRRSVCADLNLHGNQVHQMLNGQNERLSLEYKTAAPMSQNKEMLSAYYLDQFHRHRQRELVIGFTISGPHRDDLCVMLNNYDVRIYGSEGQQRSCVTSLKLAEWDRLAHQEGEKPLMLIDDVGVSLDQSRRQKLYTRLGQLGQVFLTSTDELFKSAQNRKAIAI